MTCQVLTVDIEYFQGTLNGIAHYNTGQLARSKTALRLYQSTIPIGAIPSAHDFFLTQLSLIFSINVPKKWFYATSIALRNKS